MSVNAVNMGQSLPRPGAQPMGLVGTQADNAQRVTRGTLQASAQRTAIGARVTVTTVHSAPGDTVTFTLYATIAGRQVQLATSQAVRINGTRGITTFDLDYGALTAQFQASGLGQLKMQGGVALAIGGRWQTGHVWGLRAQGRAGGDFMAP